MSEEDARRRELQARNEGLRSQIDNMMSDLRRRTDELQERQAEVAGTVHEVTSEDRMVTARVDATGTLQELTLSPKAFERTSPVERGGGGRKGSMVRSRTNLRAGQVGAETASDEIWSELRQRFRLTSATTPIAIRPPTMPATPGISPSQR